MVTERYCDFSDELVAPRQRSIRINGFATCIRLEEVYWTIIEILARQESMTVGRLLSRWALEMDMACEAVRNFTGYVRVICVVQLVRRIEMVSPEDVERIAKIMNRNDYRL
ncbi:ribbon-helix-helix domain-containing protein [Paraburkholderia bannensis]|uniref:ribbon-helix-helix domain-containing protein n=1 Tax=Paraburkholderia bannensis TaxID=765414 RepID=UPI002AC36413|nr:ribbon-helix-helix domain-containing protein [Paraburkholderia bannensis]